MAQSTLTKIKSSSGAIPKDKSKRPDIQGLRAIAVVAVIFDHLLHWPSGGFVGVDVFFVISGFLITGLLLREHDRTGTISFSGFYRRRIRRIMPAAVAVLAVTSVASYLLLNTARARETLADSVWALFFSANWHFAAVGTDYFQAGGPVSPVQHFWSLAVEEQFYFVWPWLMLLIFWAVRRTTTWDQAKKHRAVVVALIAIVALSFAWSMYESSTSPTVAYFSTMSRAWELGLGALIAALSPLLSRIPSLARPLLAWAGIAGIVWSILSISANMPFPAPWAAVPVAATALVIIAGTGGEQRLLWPLTNRVTGYVGDLSYSLYLWHFPVIVLAQALLPEETPAYYAAAAIAMAALASASFHFLEEPVRRSEWLLPKTRYGPRDIDFSRLKYILMGILAVTTAAVCFAAVMKTTPIEPETVGVVSVPTGSGVAAPVDNTPEGVLSAQIKAALAVQSFPDFNPSVDSLGIAEWSKRPEIACMNVWDVNVDACVTGAPNATKTVAVLGDSVAVAWLPGIRAAFEPLGYKVHALTLGQCPAADVAVTKAGGAPFPECATHREWAAERLRAINPDLTVLASAQESTFSRLASSRKGPDAAAEIAAGLSSTVEQISANTSRIAILGSPPDGKNLQECVTNVGKPADCVSEIGQNWYSLRDAEIRAPFGANATYVETSTWFCDGRYCPAFVGSTPIRVDTGHLTVEYSARLGPLIAAAVEP